MTPSRMGCVAYDFVPAVAANKVLLTVYYSTRTIHSVLYAKCLMRVFDDSGGDRQGKITNGMF